MPINPLSTDWLAGGIPVGSGYLPTYGVPTCLFNLGFEILQYLPGDSLAALTAGMNKGISGARQAAAEAKGFILGDLLGMEKVEGEESYGWGVDSGLGGVASFGDNLLQSIGAIAGFVQEAQNNLNSTIAEINAIVECLSYFESSVKDSITTDPQTTNSEMIARVAEAEAIVNETTEFILQAKEFIETVGNILIARANGELFDPDEVEQQDEEIFRLTFGPPESKNGSFLLSIDGLYYDSQTRTYADGSEVPTVDDIMNLSFVPNTSKWKLDHSPNLGGKGTQVTLGDIDNYIGTLFDIEIIDDSGFMQEHYEKDHTLNVLKGNKSKMVTDMERDKQNLIASGYDEDSAVISNFQKSIFSTIESFDMKVRKRKKQIEVAVKAYDLFGYDKTFLPGTVPLNDFSYLSNLNLAPGFEKQKGLVLDHGDVSGIILPIKPIFVKQATKTKSYSLTPLNIAPIGTGVFAETPSVSSTLMPALTISDAVVLDRLVAIYSFLDANVLRPDSTKTNVISCNNDPEHDAQLVGRSTDAVFNKGLGIPLLEGIVSYEPSGGLVKPGDVGSYLRLPPSKRMQDLMFNNRGASFDFWVHLPTGFAKSNRLERGETTTSVANGSLGSAVKGAWTDFNYYKLILANENIGGSYQGNPDIMPRNKNSDTVRGMVMGFTRDPQMAQRGTTASRGTDIDIAANYAIDTSATVDEYAFFIAPTQSIKDNNGNQIVEFVRSGPCESNLTTFDSMVIPNTVQTKSGYTIQDVSSGFVHMNVSFDVQSNLVSVYLNKELLSSSSMTVVMGSEIKKNGQLPSFIKKESDQSFYYSENTVNNEETSVFNNGPKNDAYFTPWIVGGGWTDGLPIDISTSSGGFMGTSHGFYSGLGGHIGSFKVYDKPLNIEEVAFNYTAHKEFFNNIRIK